MALEAAATFAGIHNENEFYSHHYLSEIFVGDIKETIKRWRDNATHRAPHAPRPAPHTALRALAKDYGRFRDAFERRADRRTGLQQTSHQIHADQIKRQHQWFRRLLGTLGYEADWDPANLPLDDDIEIPVLCAAGRSSAGAPQLLVLEAYDASAEGDDPLSIKLHPAQFLGEAPPPATLRKERSPAAICPIPNPATNWPTPRARSWPTRNWLGPAGGSRCCSRTRNITGCTTRDRAGTS